MSHSFTTSLTPHQRFRAFLLATVGVFALTTSAAHAEDAAAEAANSGGVIDLPTLVVEGEGEQGIGSALPPVYSGGQVARGGRIGVLGNQDIMDIPFSVTSYTEETIRNQQAQTLSDILANDPSVRTSFGFGNFSEQFVVRGFPLSAEDISINGVYGITPRQITGLEAFERVELLKGASAFLNGAAPSGTGIGGGINLVPKRAGDEFVTRVTGTYGMDGQIGGHVDTGLRFGNNKEWGIRLNVAGRDGETAIDNEERWYAMASAALDYRGENTRVSLDLMTHKTDIENGRTPVNLDAALTAVPDAPDANTNYAADWSYSTMHDTSVLFHVEHDLTKNVMVYGDLGYRTMREDGIYSSPTVTNLNGTANMGRLNVPREDENISGQMGVRTKFVTGNVHHNFNLGYSKLVQENRNSFEFGNTIVGATNIYNPQSVAYPTTWFAGGNFDDLPLVSRVELQSAFISDTLNFFDDRVHLTLGARHQSLKVSNFDRATFAKTDGYDSSEVTPVIGLAVNVTKAISVYANRIESLAPGPEAPTGRLNAGQIFAPYTSVQYEIGGKLDLGTLGFSAALFQTEQPLAVDGGVGTLFTVDGQQEHTGLELNAFGEVVEGWRVLGGVTLIDSELSGTAGGANDGNEGVAAPKVQANIGTEYDLPFLAGATVTARVIYTSSQQFNAANTLEVPSWTRLDLGARYTIDAGNRPLTFNLTAENVTNEGYWASANGGYLTQGRPLTAKFSVSTEF
tara:strand:+ start:54706 stop:56925 length:2220 start_codon:yes stop_codon:yes gene_type:complete